MLLLLSVVQQIVPEYRFLIRGPLGTSKSYIAPLLSVVHRTSPKPTDLSIEVTPSSAALLYTLALYKMCEEAVGRSPSLARRIAMAPQIATGSRAWASTPASHYLLHSNKTRQSAVPLPSVETLDGIFSRCLPSSLHSSRFSQAPLLPFLSPSSLSHISRLQWHLILRHIQTTHH